MISIAPGSSPLATTARHGVARLLQRAVAGEHGVETLGARQQLQRDFQRDAEEPFVAGEESATVRADLLAARRRQIPRLRRWRARP